MAYESHTIKHQLPAAARARVCDRSRFNLSRERRVRTCARPPNRCLRGLLGAHRLTQLRLCSSVTYQMVENVDFATSSFVWRRCWPLALSPWSSLGAQRRTKGPWELWWSRSEAAPYCVRSLFVRLLSRASFLGNSATIQPFEHPPAGANPIVRPSSCSARSISRATSLCLSSKAKDYYCAAPFTLCGFLIVSGKDIE